MGENKYRLVPEDLKKYLSESSQFHYYYELEQHTKAYRNIEDKFICLKGFSSSTPIVNSFTFDNECVGGGFYFRYKGHGIVVDPGIGFVSLMHKNNIFISDINTVIITHNHIDHNCDVDSLSALLHDYNNNKTREMKFYNEFFECNKHQNHEIHWYMDEDSIKRFQDILDNKYVYSLSEIYKSKKIEKINDNIAFEVIATKHIRNNDESYGIKLEFIDNSLSYKWGYTSDTKYFDELAIFFADCQIILFNISDVYEKDISGEKAKSGHLGFDGSFRLINATNSKMAIATEFCCTNGDYRHEIVKALREALKSKDTNILPAHPGLMVSVDGRNIVCSICKQECMCDDIKSAKPDYEFGKIRYICKECLI